jgi:hypothetical protein
VNTYRTILPPLDSQFYAAQPSENGWAKPWESTIYTPLEEAMEVIRGVAYPSYQEDGSIAVIFEAEDLYELAEMVKGLENELNANGYWQHLVIDRPVEVYEP